MVKKCWKKSFTLIELLVTVSILLVLLGVGLFQYETYDKRNNLILTADSLKSFIESAKNDARGQGSDIAIESDYSNVMLKLDTTLHVINEYRCNTETACYQSGSPLQDKVFNSYTVSDKIKLMKNATTEWPARTIIASFEIPAGKLATASSPIILTYGDTVTLNINENSITTTQGF